MNPIVSICVAIKMLGLGSGALPLLRPCRLPIRLRLNSSVNGAQFSSSNWRMGVSYPERPGTEINFFREGSRSVILFYQRVQFQYYHPVEYAFQLEQGLKRVRNYGSSEGDPVGRCSSLAPGLEGEEPSSAGGVGTTAPELPASSVSVGVGGSGVSVGRGVSVGSGVSVGGTGVSVGVGSSVGVGVCGVSVGVGESVSVGVKVGVGVEVGVAVSVGVGVKGVGKGVNVGKEVSVTVGDRVGARIGVIIGVGLAPISGASITAAIPAQ
jgi:hypothetical protein